MILLLLTCEFGYSVVAQCASEEDVHQFTFNGHKYEVIRTTMTWAAASACAVERGGYLAEINTREEQDTIYQAVIVGAAVPADYTSVMDGGGIAYVWIGATDQQTEGTWLWDGDGDNIGIHFWSGQGSAGTGDGTAVDELYQHWGGSSSGDPNEPDDYGAGQDGAAIALAKWPAGSDLTLGIASEWNDISIDNSLYFVVEHNCVDTYFHVDVEMACKFYVTPDGEIWTTSGSYMDTIRTAEGCDSIYAEFFNVITVDTAVVQDVNTLTAGSAGATYQWLDCNNGYAVMEGETGQSFTPSSSGSYAVEITAFGFCADTSSCHTAGSTVGIGGRSTRPVTARQLAGTGEIVVDLGDVHPEVIVQVIDITGRMVYSGNHARTREIRFQLDEPPGIYFIRVKTGDDLSIIRLMRD